MADFLTHGTRDRSKQGRRWVESKARQGQHIAVIKHVMANHVMDGAESPCSSSCGLTAQEVCDLISWKWPGGDPFYYSTAWRNYPRLMDVLPGLDHSRYLLALASRADVFQFMSVMSRTGQPMTAEIGAALSGRGGVWNGKSVAKFMSKPASARSLMLSRWRRNPDLDLFADLAEVAEVQLS